LCNDNEEKPLAGYHERLSRRENIQPGTERSFGITFAVVFLLIALVIYWSGGGIAIWAIGCAIAFFLAAFIFPPALAPLNRLWFKLGLLLHHVVSPVILGFLFFGTVTPFAFFIRWFGKELLALEKDKSAQSYWKRRVPPGPDPETVRNQF
jgi:hypothetical protein